MRVVGLDGVREEDDVDAHDHDEMVVVVVVW